MCVKFCCMRACVCMMFISCLSWLTIVPWKQKILTCASAKLIQTLLRPLIMTMALPTSMTKDMLWWSSGIHFCNCALLVFVDFIGHFGLEGYDSRISCIHVLHKFKNETIFSHLKNVWSVNFNNVMVSCPRPKHTTTSNTKEVTTNHHSVTSNVTLVSTNQLLDKQLKLQLTREDG